MAKRWKSPVRRIVSGGQTGVDRGALDAAIAIGLEHGGWCPRGRLAEDGEIPAQYELQETPTERYRERTERNVLDSDGTLVIYREVLAGGTDLTWRFARQNKKPYLLVDLSQPLDVDAIRQWLTTEKIETLNVAGPRESSVAGIAQESRRLIRSILINRSR